MGELVFFRRGEEVLRFSLEPGHRTVVGRGDGCDVVVPDPEVSRTQVALTYDGTICHFEDLSTKGTVVAGEKLAKGELSDGTDLALGQWRAVFRARTSGSAADATEVGDRTELVAQGEVQNAPRLAAQIKVRTGGKEAAHKLQVDAFTIGKDESNDLVLNQKFVSSRHLKVTREGNRFHLVDQQSTNGTWLGNVRLYEADVPFYSSLRLGEAELTIEPQATSSRTAVNNYQGIIGNDPSVTQLAELIERVAPSSAAVAVFGESGTGKELVARAIHARSRRADAPFIPVNCAAISKELIESELFGHEKGSFTGAASTHKGAFEEADGGTLFLDEIGELPLEMQAKLLRALESGEIKRVGSAKPMNVDVRIVAATNRDLMADARQGRFREDLYYRLCVIPLMLVPLRNRLTDVHALADHFVKQFAPRGQNVRLSAQAIERLTRHGWPGNIRELRNVIHRALLLRKGTNIEAEDLTFDTQRAPDPSAFFTLGPLPEGLALENMMAAVEKTIITTVLEQQGGNRERALKQLQMSRSALYKRLKDWGLEEQG